MGNKELLNKIDGYQEMIQKHRPLTPREVKELDEYFKIGLTYTSNALEGNSLTRTVMKRPAMQRLMIICWRWHGGQIFT